MRRGVLLASLLPFLLHPAAALAAAAQGQGVLVIKVVLSDAQGNPAPVPRHELLISDNPATAAPRVITTKLDGTAEVKLRPGNYTVESDHPVVFQGKAYGWTQVVDVAAGATTVLELSAANAEVLSPSSRTASGAPLEADPSFLVAQWQGSVVALWTPLTRASAFVADSRGLVVTSQRAVGTSRDVEVQITPATKVAGIVLSADRSRDVAVIGVDSRAIESVTPIPLACGKADAGPALRAEEGVFTIAVPLRESTQVVSGTISRVEAGAVLADFIVDADGAGGPVFARDGHLAGITSLVGDEDEDRRGDVRIVPLADVCAALASAGQEMARTAPPGAVALPTEPARTFPERALRAIVQKRAGSLSPYTISSSEFDISFITPVQTYAVQFLAEQARDRERNRPARGSVPPQAPVSPLMDFGHWAQYAEDIPPVLFVRVTPKMTEGFWTRVGRGAARTQGMAIPPLRRFTYSFSRLHAFCGDTEVVPIHPFKIAHRVSDALTVYEGLYVFDPASLAPGCGTINLVMFSDRQQAKADTRGIDANVIQQIWRDFEPYRRPTR